MKIQSEPIISISFKIQLINVQNNKKFRFQTMEIQTGSDSFELLAILLVSQSSGGAHLLFKYPFSDSSQKKSDNSSMSSDKSNWIIEKLDQINHQLHINKKV